MNSQFGKDDPFIKGIKRERRKRFWLSMFGIVMIILMTYLIFEQ